MEDINSKENMLIPLGKRIRQLRKDKNLKIVEIANITGLTVSMISQVERALISPSIETLKRIGNALNIPVSYLFVDVDQPVFQSTQPFNPQDVDINANQSTNVNTNSESIGALTGAFRQMQNPVVHEHQRKMLSPGKGVHFYLLNPNMNGPIEFIYNVYDPGSSTGDDLYTHPGTECGLILEGELVVQIIDNVYVLKKGDSITFNSSDPHSKRNMSDKVCTCVWANDPPWF